MLCSQKIFFLLFLSESFPSNKNLIWSSKNMLLCPPFLFWITSPSWLVCVCFFSSDLKAELEILWDVEALKSENLCSLLSVNKNEAFFTRCFCLRRLTYTELVSFFSLNNTKKICQQAFLSVRGLKKATANLPSLPEIFLLWCWFPAYFKKN